jgi:hypothetical protein
MIPVFKHQWRVALATVALGSIGLSGAAFAQTNTLSGTTITNTATVNYSVATIPQTPINAVAEFRVDTIIDLNVSPVASAVTFTPGQTNVLKTFTVSNTSNIVSNFNLAAVNLSGDGFNMYLPGTTTDGINIRVDGNANGTYEPGTDTATSVTALAARTGSVAVFVIGDVPVGATNGQTANIQLDATAINPADSNPWASTGGADGAMTVETVVRNGTANATNGFVIASAALSVSKLSRVVSDPVNLTSNPKAIPGAIMEYEITVTNAVGAQTATVTSISDPVPANTAFQAGEYAGGSDVGVKIGAGAEFFCVAEVGTDTNNDGCRINGGAVTVGTPAITTIAANTSIVVRFRVKID